MLTLGVSMVPSAVPATSQAMVSVVLPVQVTPLVFGDSDFEGAARINHIDPHGIDIVAAGARDVVANGETPIEQPRLGGVALARGCGVVEQIAETGYHALGIRGSFPTAENGAPAVIGLRQR